MKKFLLVTALAALSISATEANWGGFYARGGLNAVGSGVTDKLKDTAVKGRDGFALAASFEIAAGWGMILSDAVYLGVDAQVGNFNMNYTSAEGSDSKTMFEWSPNLQARVGLPLKSAMPYIAGGVGFQKIVSQTGIDTLPEGKLSWSARVGSDFKVTDNFFVGVYGQFVKTFNEESGEGALKTTKGTSATVFGFNAGYQF